MPTTTPHAGRGKGWRSGVRSTSSLPARIRIWLLDNPGYHRAKDIAAALTPPPQDPPLTAAQWQQKVANALARLARDGGVVRADGEVGHAPKCTGGACNCKPVGTYALTRPQETTRA